MPIHYNICVLAALILGVIVSTTSEDSEKEVCTDDLVAAYVNLRGWQGPRVILCSAYLPGEKKDPSVELTPVVDYARKHNAELLVGCDANAHHTNWGSTNINDRGVIWAAPGSDTELPCNLSPPGAGDAVGMVLWFKDAVRMPLYTVDFRNGPPVHWAVTDDLGSRSHFVLNEASPAQAHLAVSKVSRHDEGVYRCRIDFVNSPTRNYKVNLTVVVPPEDPRIYDAEGREILGSVAGPFREGDNLLLSCQVTGGKPTPEVSWWRGPQRLDSLVDVSSRGAVVSQLYLGSLARNLSGARLQCRADFTPLLPALHRDVMLKIYLKPQTAHIRTDGVIRAGHDHSYVCSTRGSRPAPNIDWFLGSQRIDGANTQTEVSGNLTSSVLSWRARREDGGRTLVCRVSNPWFPAHTVQDSILLDVVYPPVVTLTLESPPDPRRLREDQDAELLCSADANPPADSFAFYKDNREIHEDPVGGVTVAGARLRLRMLRRHHSSRYSCRAINAEGESRSEQLRLDVLYRPECSAGSETQQLTGAAGGVVRARCAVQAPPSAQAGVLRFYWTYNNASKNVLPIPAANITVSGASSTAEHGVPAGAGGGELGQLACWARNDVGNQREPCLYRIIAAALPEPPTRCAVLEDAAELRCEPGHDGGLPQHFILEVLETAPHVTQPASQLANEISTMNDQGVTSRVSEAVYRASSDSPQFSLDALAPGRYTLLVYAETPRGRSPRPAALHSVTVRSLPDLHGSGSLQTLTPGPPPAGDSSAALVVGAALSLVLLTLLTTLCVSLVVMCKRKSPRRYREEDRRSVGVSMYGGACAPVILAPTVAARGNRRSSRVLSARWSGILDAAPAELSLPNGSETSISEGEIQDMEMERYSTMERQANTAE